MQLFCVAAARGLDAVAAGRGVGYEEHVEGPRAGLLGSRASTYSFSVSELLIV